jgi:predicted transcriptional regulator
VCSILISIRPEYVREIFEGRKLYEYRKRLPRRKVDKIIVYSTAPEMRVVGEVNVVDSVYDTPTA